LKRRLLTIVLAALLAVFGLVAVFAYVHQANERAISGLQAETVWYAKQAIPAGTSVAAAQQDKMLTTEKVPVSSLSAESEPVQSVTGADAKMFMSVNVGQGQVLLQNMLVSTASVAPTGNLDIPSGMVAVTIQMCIPEAVAGYVTANSDVNVYAVWPASANETLQRTCGATHSALQQNATNTKIVLQKVLVLSVVQAPAPGQSTSSGGSSVMTDPLSSSSSSSSLSSGTEAVTFAVTSKEAIKLIQISQVGLPYLALLRAN
jgi:pilus assembly protein CpaB